MSERDDAAHIEFLVAEIEKLRAQVKDRDAQISRLKKEKGLSSARDGLTFDSHTGLWSDQSGQLYCPTCLDKDKRNPLKTEKYGWRCTAGGHFFGNPDRRLEVLTVGY